MVRKALIVLAVVCVALATRDAGAEPPRFAVVVGNNDGLPGEGKLRYAESDALEMFEVLQGLGGFPAANALLLRGADADDVGEALLTVNARIRSLSPAERAQSMLVVYYSGHGDAESLHLGRTQLPLDRITKLVSGSAAAYRVLILDACRSGAATRVKGGKAVAPVRVILDERLTSEGLVVVTASTAGEDAQESDDLKGSFFSHYLVSGLLGAADADGDGAVTLQEAYEYAYQHTLRASSRTLHGMQHPTFQFDLRGQRAVPLTQLRSTRRATLELPRGRSVLLFRDDASGPVVAELGADDQRRSLSLLPGTYFVRVRASDVLLEGGVTLAPGDTRTLDLGGFRRTAYARLVRKGADGMTMVHGPRLSYRMRSSLAGPGTCDGVSLGYAFERRHITVIPKLSWCRERRDGSLTNARLDELAAVVGVGHAWDLRFGLSVEVSALAGIAGLAQRFDGPTDAPGRDSLAAIIGTELGVVRDAPGGYYVHAHLGTRSYMLRVDPNVYGDTEVGQQFAVEGGFGIGKRW